MLVCVIVWFICRVKIISELMIVIVVSVSNFVVLLVNNVFVFMCRIGVINLFIVLNRFIKLIFVVSVVLESSCVGIV